MPRAVVPDTAVFIKVLREQRAWPGFREDMASGRLWLSSVVLAELHAGTRSRGARHLLDQMEALMSRAQRLLTPEAGDWTRAGRLLARRARLRGALRLQDHLADLLILVSAARLGGAVSTSNVGHFEAWAQLARDAGLDVIVVPYGN